MKILLLSCSTGEGHNHCALAVKEALDAAGHETSFLDMLHMFGDPGPLSFDKLLNRISSRTPEVFGMMYHAGEMYSSTGVTSPVYLANLRHARQLSAFVTENGYDAVVCSHLFPMETLTFLPAMRASPSAATASSRTIPASRSSRRRSLTGTSSRMTRCAEPVSTPVCRPAGSSPPVCPSRASSLCRSARQTPAPCSACRRIRRYISS